jgi:hypothetical protein
MATDRPFYQPGSSSLDGDQLLEEAIPLAKLVLVVGAVAVIPILLQMMFVEALGLLPVSLQWLFAVLTQFVLAVGAGLILLYVVARAIQVEQE